MFCLAYPVCPSQKFCVTGVHEVASTRRKVWFVMLDVLPVAAACCGTSSIIDYFWVWQVTKRVACCNVGFPHRVGIHLFTSRQTPQHKFGVQVGVCTLGVSEVQRAWGRQCALWQPRMALEFHAGLARNAGNTSAFRPPWSTHQVLVLVLTSPVCVCSVRSAVPCCMPSRQLHTSDVGVCDRTGRASSSLEVLC